MLWTLLAACGPPIAGTPPDGQPDDTEEPGTPTGDTAVPTDPTDSGDTTTPSVTTEPYDCSVLPTLPVQYDTMQGWGTAEDFDFDVDGFHVAVLNTNLVGHDQAGAQKIVSPNIGSFTSGTRVLPSGDWVVADSGTGSLVRVDALTGGQETIASGLSYPNGVEVDRDGYAFVAENGAGKVSQFDPLTKERFPVANGLSNSNGLAFNADESILYVGSFGSGLVWGVPRLGPTEWGPSFVLWSVDGNDGGFDGINTDICGNVYITEYIVGKVWRITPDGLTGELVVDLPSSWIPNMRWGTGAFGWDTDVLYVADRDQGRLFALQMGIQGRPHVSVP